MGGRDRDVGLGGAAPGQGQVGCFQRGHETRRVRGHGGGQGEGLFPAGGGGGRQRIGIGQGGEGVLEARRHPGGPPGAPGQFRFRPGRDGAGGEVFLEQLVDEQHVVPLFLDDTQRLAALEQAFRRLAAPEERQGVVPAGADPGSVARPAPFLHAERQPRQGRARAESWRPGLTASAARLFASRARLFGLHAKLKALRTSPGASCARLSARRASRGTWPAKPRCSAAGVPGPVREPTVGHRPPFSSLSRTLGQHSPDEYDGAWGQASTDPRITLRSLRAGHGAQRNGGSEREPRCGSPLRDRYPTLGIRFGRSVVIEAPLSRRGRQSPNRPVLRLRAGARRRPQRPSRSP